MIVNAKKHQALVIVKLTMLVKYIRNDYRFDSHISTVCKKIINVFNVMLRNSEKLETLEKRILRFINDYTSHYTTLLNKVEMTSSYKRAHSGFFDTTLQESIFQSVSNL